MEMIICVGQGLSFCDLTQQAWVRLVDYNTEWNIQLTYPFTSESWYQVYPSAVKRSPWNL